MINAAQWARELRRQGYGFAAGVPCSSLSPLMDEILNDPEFDYVAATNEGQAVAMAAGAWTGGTPSVVLMQNSGLGNAVNPLTSLNEITRIPALLVISWRGQPGIKDEPQHRLMGEITPNLLTTLNIPHEVLQTEQNAATTQLQSVCEAIRKTGRSHAIVVPDKTFARGNPAPAFDLPKRSQMNVTDLTRNTAHLGRADALRHIIEDQSLDGAIRIATTGKTGRELFTISDDPQNLYMVGSMGMASSFALGLSRQVDKNIVVIDGDGAAMMHMGALATIGSYGSSSLKHLILDNDCYDSTGGQFSNSSGVDFASIALSCGYAASFRVDCRDGLSEALSTRVDGAVAIHMKIKPGSMSPLGRPDVTPDDVVRRLQSWLTAPAHYEKERSYA